ncbi:AbrB/MazE/SpoVT family DNA-binding domain-containing protein [Halovivax limisalsi]|uniref:AbrB/MazE/SpoVT family DNA-binding domain-containing protein n=1 Tax=Halovivax limisalsi TaxID=1453760 RepID=UPI001FFCA341|nr:AbrB/MazE/SpoVT family DNA-binding domain-containing protein [Halovivax limisalsi]
MSVETPDAVERTVQLAGNSTFVVSLPKEWALEQGIERGTPIQLYPHDDRLVLAAEPLDPPSRSIRIDAVSMDASLVPARVTDAYAAGCDRITVVDSTGLDAAIRRDVTALVGELIGLEIQRETETELVAADVLDAADVSLAQTVSQIRHRTNAAYDAAIEAVVDDDADLATRATERVDDVDRLVGFVRRGFRRGLADVTELARVDADRTDAFDHYRTAQRLSRLGEVSDRIATVADRQSAAPDPSVGPAVEAADEAVRGLLEPALAGRTRSARCRYPEAREDVATLATVAREREGPDAVRYETLADCLQRVASTALSLSESVVDADGTCC